jgi:hypothetical protein
MDEEKSLAVPTDDVARVEPAKRMSGSSWNFGGDPRGLTVRR